MGKDVQTIFLKVWERNGITLFLHSQKRKRLDDSVAQLVEHDTFNVGVLGSSPSGITKAYQMIGFFLSAAIRRFLRC
jgi:hypothetical protein